MLCVRSKFFPWLSRTSNCCVNSGRGGRIAVRLLVGFSMLFMHEGDGRQQILQAKRGPRQFQRSCPLLLSLCPCSGSVESRATHVLLGACDFTVPDDNQNVYCGHSQ